MTVLSPSSSLPYLSYMLFLLLPSGDPAETDYTAVGCAVTTISSNLTEMSRGVKLLAALLEDEGGSGRPLLQAAKGLAGAVSELLRSAQPASAEVRGHRADTRDKRGFKPKEKGTVQATGWKCGTRGHIGPMDMWAGVGQLLTGVHSLQPRQNLLQAAGNVGQASGELLQQIGESDTDPHFQVGDLPNPQNPSF